jgi:hypothetical protein
LIACLIFKTVAHKPSFKQVKDRISWKFGKTNINVLTLAIMYDGVAFPILISMLDKLGNSHTLERVEVINSYKQLVCIDIPEINIFKFLPCT